MVDLTTKSDIAEADRVKKEEEGKNKTSRGS